MRGSQISLLVMGFFLLSCIECLAEEDGMRGPWGPSPSMEKGSRNKAGAYREEISSLPGLAIIQGILFFKNTISRVDGDRCPSYPTCAEYGEIVVRKHGPIIGILMIIDRLIHEASESKTSPMITKYGARRIYDPPENNDFWFTK